MEMVWSFFSKLLFGAWCCKQNEYSAIQTCELILKINFTKKIGEKII